MLTGTISVEEIKVVHNLVFTLRTLKCLIHLLKNEWIFAIPGSFYLCPVCSVAYSP